MNRNIDQFITPLNEEHRNISYWGLKIYKYFYVILIIQFATMIAINAPPKSSKKNDEFQEYLTSLTFPQFLKKKKNRIK